MFVRSPGRGGSVCRHSWISDLPASVSFSLSVCVSLSPSLSLLPLLHLPLFSHHVDLVSFLYKRLRERWQRLHGPWFLFCFVLFCCWGSLKKRVGLPPCSPSVLTRLYQRLRWSTCHPWTNHCDWGLNSLIGQVPVRSPFGLKEWVSPCHSHWGGEGLEARYTQAIFWTLFCPFYRYGPQSKKMSNLRMQTHQSISKILSEKQNSDGHSASKGPPHLVLRSGYYFFLDTGEGCYYFFLDAGEGFSSSAFQTNLITIFFTCVHSRWYLGLTFRPFTCTSVTVYLGFICFFDLPCKVDGWVFKHL